MLYANWNKRVLINFGFKRAPENLSNIFPYPLYPNKNWDTLSLGVSGQNNVVGAKDVLRLELAISV